MSLKQQFSSLFSSARTKLASLRTKLRLWTSPSFLRAKAVLAVRQSLPALLDVRPRHQDDYYPIFRWLVSKRLAFAAVVVLGLLCSLYLYATLPQNFFHPDAGSIRTYRYDALPLKFYSGTVQILAGDGHLAYVGEVDKSHCTGQGTLYDREGHKVYEGAFENDRYHGEGTLYYPEGTVRYRGSFRDNLFQGQGSYYRPTGAVEYVGEHESGRRNGQGVLYNAAARPIFSGTFQMDQIVYSQFLDIPTSAAAGMYTGKTRVYAGQEEYAVSMDEIGAVYAAGDGSNSLDGEWTVERIYVLSSAFPVEGDSLTRIDQLSSYFGQPDYYGTSAATLPEAVAVNLLAQGGNRALGVISMEGSASFDEIYTVSRYDQSAQLYLYSYLKDGLLYTFYTAGAGEKNFVMYAVEITAS